MKQRIIVIVIDIFGIGALSDAERYEDERANTALHICEQILGNKWDTLREEEPTCWFLFTRSFENKLLQEIPENDELILKRARAEIARKHTPSLGAE